MKYQENDIVSFETRLGDAPGYVDVHKDDGGVIIRPDTFQVDPEELREHYDIEEDSFKLEVRPDLEIFTKIRAMKVGRAIIEPIGPLKVPEEFVNKWGEKWYDE